MQTTKFPSAKLQKKIIQAISYSELKDYRANSVDLDEVAHDEPPHQDLRCLQIQIISSLVLEELSRALGKGTCVCTNNKNPDLPANQCRHIYIV